MSKDMEGMILINKPSGMTSHDVVMLLRRKLGMRRIGHTGTLDPIAQGLLVLLIGKATKFQQVLQSHEKVYEAVINFGEQTETGDAAGRVIQTGPIPPIDPNRVQEVLSSFHGPVQQTPPRYSAVKVRGHPAYWWARRSQEVTLSPKTIHIFELLLLKIEAESIAIRVHCSAGTYIRTLAESVAQQLGTVGHVKSLVRHRIGEWTLRQALELEWVKQSDRDRILKCLLPVHTPYASTQRY